MNDIFVSYARADRDRAELLAEAFSRQGWSVWWDREILPGKSFDETIEDALNSARCVIVLWSKHSVSSRWVKTEAAEGAARGILVPALIDNVQIPLEFRRIQAADLSDWEGISPHSEFDQLLTTVAGILGGSALTQIDQMSTNTKFPSRRRWKTRLGILAATGGAITAAIGLFILIHQAGLLDGKENNLSQTQYHEGSTPFKSEADYVLPKPVPLVMKDQAPSGAKPTSSTQSQSSIINLLSPENGGHVIVGTNDGWLAAIDGNEKDWEYLGQGFDDNWAVYGFKDNRPAIFDTFKVLILGAQDWNLKEFELLIGNDSATGKFESIGKFQTQNIRFFKDSYQEFRFPTVKARYLKVRLISSHGFVSVGIYEFQLLGVIER